MSQLILPRTGILAFMDDESREQFASYGSVFDTAPGQVILQEGEANTNLYVVLHGAFKVTTKVTGREIDLDTLGEGECIGEIAVFQPGPVSANVTSTEAGKLWAIDVDHLQQFLIDWPHSGCAAVLGINTILSRRLKRANSVIRSNEIIPSFLSVRAKKRTEGANLS
jgi:CRP/FNR family transcriptional regulator, cyclic AMP receptor protein